MTYYSHGWLMLYDYSVLPLNGLRVNPAREHSRLERTGYEGSSHVFSHSKLGRLASV
jgi:hypothetical protein